MMTLLTSRQFHELEEYLVQADERRAGKEVLFLLLYLGSVFIPLILFGFLGIPLCVLAVIAAAWLHNRGTKKQGKGASARQRSEAELLKRNEYRCKVVTVSDQSNCRRNGETRYLMDTQGIEYICPFEADFRSARAGCQMVAVEVGHSQYILRADVLDGKLSLEEEQMKQQGREALSMAQRHAMQCRDPFAAPEPIPMPMADLYADDTALNMMMPKDESML